MLSRKTDFEGFISHVAQGILDLLLHLKILQCVVDHRLGETSEGDGQRRSTDDYLIGNGGFEKGIVVDPFRFIFQFFFFRFGHRHLSQLEKDRLCSR